MYKMRGGFNLGAFFLSKKCPFVSLISSKKSMKNWIDLYLSKSKCDCFLWFLEMKSFKSN